MRGAGPKSQSHRTHRELGAAGEHSTVRPGVHEKCSRYQPIRSPFQIVLAMESDQKNREPGLADHTGGAGAVRQPDHRNRKPGRAAELDVIVDVLLIRYP